jgi:hypothetical protein
MRSVSESKRVFPVREPVLLCATVAIARDGDEGDDFAALKKAQDTLAGSAHERLDSHQVQSAFVHPPAQTT